MTVSLDLGSSLEEQRHDLTAFCMQTLSFYFPSCGKIPPPVIMVQNVSFKYSKDGVSEGCSVGGGSFSK